MAREFDGVIDAVRHDAEGRVVWARAYLRRWPHVYGGPQILSRQALLERLRQGQTFAVGQRRAFWGNTFEILTPIHLKQRQGADVLEAQAGETAELATAPRL